MPVDEFVSSDSWLIELLGSYTAEVRKRGLVVHHELDSQFHLRRDRLLVTALEGLFRFVFSTLPDGCEIYLASTHRNSPVATVGSGELTLRWQVAGTLPRPVRGNVTSIRPISGGAAFHAQSSAAAELEAAFLTAGWSLDLAAANGDQELWARARKS
jgi:hypothetical protein